jgi:hypothetical protein
MITTENKTPEEIRSDFLAREALRLIRLESVGYNLLEDALDGREKSVENIVKLWRLVASSYQASMSLPAGRVKDGWTRYWELCSEFLVDAGWTAEQLRHLRYPPPVKGPDVIDDLGSGKPSGAK